jgi:hypothetical protein
MTRMISRLYDDHEAARAAVRALEDAGVAPPFWIRNPPTGWSLRHRIGVQRSGRSNEITGQVGGRAAVKREADEGPARCTWWHAKEALPRDGQGL